MTWLPAPRNPQQSTTSCLAISRGWPTRPAIAVHDSLGNAGQLAEFIALVESKTINSKIAKDLVTRMWNGEGSPEAIVQREGLAQTSDPAAVAGFIDQVLATTKKRDDYRAGKTNVMGFLVGQVMKASAGKADPQMVNRLMKEKLEG